MKITVGQLRRVIRETLEEMADMPAMQSQDWSIDYLRRLPRVEFTRLQGEAFGMPEGDPRREAYLQVWDETITPLGRGGHQDFPPVRLPGGGYR
jgi:hypothetical protein